MKIARYVTIALALVFAAACGTSSTPIGPTTVGSPPPPPTPVPPVTGEISLAAASAASGATLRLRDCSIFRGGNTHSSGPVWCTDDLKLEFGVVVDRDLPNAMLRLTFVTGDGRECGFATTSKAALAAHSRALVSTSIIEFYGIDPDPQSPPDFGCPTVPSVTRSLRVQLLDVSESQGRAPTLLFDTFDLTYTFGMAQ